MREQHDERPASQEIDASAGQRDDDLDTASPNDGNAPAQLSASLRGRPSGEAQEAIECATAVVGDDEGDAS
ncbi:hypothetical protein [Methylobacterium haplocladii]|uniref:Uncharacterized protein n=1 Tax=Methylobacterium haplocladii TaxID=1176176 RepID=A0A512IQB3_9HYPH|nr:hypothetical protein [Methylobacterium haplocladii]GEO99862.1 hypothetical protein MHA02_22500 [Methylobacterium haplocladii]GJD82778.1 hypothetical protein HPGCJGGD_0638 [Methylobacterium haplocladii]GLS58026.1 hypothetical protein GCM10007887_06820 [Methylobacterium haplocladii]